MFKAIKEFLFGKLPEQKAQAPYKVEAPTVEAVKAPAPVAEAPAPVAESTPVVEAKPAAMTAKKKPANKKPAGEKKPGAKKGGRKPKAKNQPA